MPLGKYLKPYVLPGHVYSGEKTEKQEGQRKQEKFSETGPSVKGNDTKGEQDRSSYFLII